VLAWVDGHLEHGKVDITSNRSYADSESTSAEVKMHGEESLMLLDKLDLMIMEELEDDARQPVDALARKLGAKRTTTLRRLNRLMDEGVMKTACIVRPEFLGFQFVIVLAITVHPGKATTVANQLADLPNVNVVFLTTGRYAVLAGVILRDRAALTHFVLESLSAISDIITTDIIYSYQWVKLTYKYFKPHVESSSNNTWENPSDLDLSIIKAMQADPRQTLTKLAQTVGCRTSVARKRLDLLVNQGAITFTIIVDPTALGYNIGVMVLVKVKQDHVSAVANELAKQNIARHVSLITGQWQIIIMAQFPDSRHMNHFLSKELPLVSGVIEYEVVQLVRTRKYTSNLFYA